MWRGVLPLRRGYLLGPARFLRGEKYQLLVWRGASQCWKQEGLQLPAQQATASPRSSPSSARAAGSRCWSQMQGPVGLILGWDHAALMETRDLWAGSSMEDHDSRWRRRKSSVRAQQPLALILSRWRHTTHFVRLAQHHLLGSGSWSCLLFFVFLEA